MHINVWIRVSEEIYRLLFVLRKLAGAAEL